MSHSKHVAPKITPERWAHLKSLRVRPRMFWSSSRRGTYDVNRNKLKEMRRALCGVRK